VADAGELSAKTPAPRPSPAKPKPEPVELEADSPFRTLGLSETVLLGVKHAGYTSPTPIQAQAIPVLVEGKDLIGSAQTGTGKTAAFVLPILHRLGAPGKLRCLILEPTRELADQVRENLDTLSVFTGLHHAAIFGGVKHGPQREALRRGIDILVATPGRLLDHVEAGDLSLKDIEIVVLDEVDRMLDIGFLPQVKRVMKLCPTARQTMLFSATVPEEIARLADWVLKDPVRIEIGIKRSVADTITHGLYPVDPTQKFDLLLELLKKTDFKSVIIFCRTRAGADRIWEWLKAQGHKVGVLHSDRSQGQRMEALAGFKEGKYEVLVATDLAARGLDIASVTHVINYNVPEHPEDYVHRIGRTGRANKDGDAFTLFTGADLAHVEAIEKFLGRTIDRIRVESFNYDPDPGYLFEARAAQVVAPPTRSFRFRGRR
jgi:superfamily II DNA/RNA helicase